MSQRPSDEDPQDATGLHSKFGLPTERNERIGPPIPDQPTPGLRDFLAIEAWAEREIPPSDRLLGDLVTTTTRMFLVGRTGLGKTMLGFGLACGLASGGGFLHWRCTRPARVLYIDGEMPDELIRQRAIDALRRAGIVPKPGYLTIYARDAEGDFVTRFPDLGPMPPLNTPVGHQWMLALIASIGDVDVVFFDNVMSLVEGDQKDETSWSHVLPLVQKLTGKRIGQVWLDHTGHNSNRQYGSSTKAWRADTVGIMTPVTEVERSDVAFSLSFDHPGKARRRTPDNWQDFETVTIRLTGDQWTSEFTNGKGSTGKTRKIPPSRQPFYDALLAAITMNPAGQACTTMSAWEEMCIDRGVISGPPVQETAEQRHNRYNGLRRAKSELARDQWIAIGGDTVSLTS
jgi:hypothetical protein